MMCFIFFQFQNHFDILVGVIFLIPIIWSKEKHIYKICSLGGCNFNFSDEIWHKDSGSIMSCNCRRYIYYGLQPPQQKWNFV